MTNWPPPFKKKNHSSPRHDRPLCHIDILSPRLGSTRTSLSLSLSLSSNPKIHEKQEVRREEERKGGMRKRRKRRRNGGGKGRNTRFYESLENVLFMPRTQRSHPLPLSLSLSLSPSPSPRFTKRAHRQRVVSNFNYKPEEERWTRVFRNAAGMWN